MNLCYYKHILSAIFNYTQVMNKNKHIDIIMWISHKYEIAQNANWVELIRYARPYDTAMQSKKPLSAYFQVNLYCLLAFIKISSLTRSVQIEAQCIFCSNNNKAGGIVWTVDTVGLQAAAIIITSEFPLCRTQNKMYPHIATSSRTLFVSVSVICKQCVTKRVMLRESYVYRLYFTVHKKLSNGRGMSHSLHNMATLIIRAYITYMKHTSFQLSYWMTLFQS